MCPFWARLSVRIQDGFLAVPQESAFPEDVLFFHLKGDLCFAWMPFEVGASRLGYQKTCHSLPQLQAGMPPHVGCTLARFVAEVKAWQAYGDESSEQVLFDYLLLMKSSRFEVFV